VLEAVLREQPKWASHGAPEPGLILQIASTAGLDTDAARTQMLAPGVVAVLNQDRADVETVGVRQTPTFFVNGKPLDPFGEAELRRLVAVEVAANQS
jgi:2-hydroxychromene-2-carboxylate isomerase